MARQVHILPRSPPRPRDSHKGTYGRLLVIAGTPGMCGAAVLSARAALRTGTGLVTISAPASLASALTSSVPEATLRFLPEVDSGEEPTIDAEGFDAEGFDAIAIGPGLGTSSWSRALTLQALEGLTLPHVVDADALNIIAAESTIEISAEAQRVWTPHPGEFERLTGERPRTEDERVAASERFVRARGGVLVLKGSHSIVHEGDRYAINLSGNPGMATGGSGDVLTGVIGSLLAQGMSPFDAAQLGTHLHGVAGDLAVRRASAPSLIASDLVDYLGAAWRTLSSHR